MANKLPRKWFPSPYIVSLRERKVDRWAERSKEHQPYFETWRDAHQWMIQNGMTRIDEAKRNLERAKKALASAERYLNKVKAMQEPKQNDDLPGDKLE